MPTIKKLLAVLKEDINFPGSRESLRLLLHKLGYKYKKCNNKREEPGVSKAVATGKRYILVHAGGSTGFVKNALLIYNDKEKKTDYHESKNKDNFKKWVTERLLPNLDDNSCVVMDNTKYHTYQINKAPNLSWRKDLILKWLDEQNICYPTNATKPTLLTIAKKFKPDPKYEILKDHGHTVIRLPPYHCDFNPIEIIWGIGKNKVASKKCCTRRRNFFGFGE